jgi:hypothetical protein
MRSLPCEQMSQLELMHFRLHYRMRVVLERRSPNCGRHDLFNTSGKRRKELTETERAVSSVALANGLGVAAILNFRLSGNKTFVD